jgi:hypothetical protein
VGSIAISSIVFACVSGGAITGILFRNVLPKHHLSTDSQYAVRLAMGLVGTTSALVLGLLISSGKTYYDRQSAELTQTSARIIFLDRVLAHYGPETKEARDRCAPPSPTVSIGSGRRSAEETSRWHRHPPPRKLSLTKFRHCLRRTTCNARSRPRRLTLRWVSAKRAG